MKTKQMSYELPEVGFVRITEYMVSDSGSVSTTEIRKGESLSVGLSVAISFKLSEFTNAELINGNQVN